MSKKNLSPELSVAIETKIADVISSFNETAAKKLKKTISKKAKALTQDYSSLLKKIEKKAKKELSKKAKKSSKTTNLIEVAKVQPVSVKRTVKTTDKIAQPKIRTVKAKQETVAAIV